MGLTKSSTGIKAVDSGLIIKKQTPDDKVVAIAGNPNVGKSTIFNNLTGMNQHTGNWPGKTVSNAQGYCRTSHHTYVCVDIPGTYSLMAHSTEEEIARNFICFGEADAVIVMCDATCLERNLNLVLQTLEITDKVLVCVNLMDEAKRKDICIDLDSLSNRLGIPVSGTNARKKKTLSALMEKLDSLIDSKSSSDTIKVTYCKAIEDAIAMIEPILKELFNKESIVSLNSRWLSLKLLDYDSSLINEVNHYLEKDILQAEVLTAVLAKTKTILAENGIDSAGLKDNIVSSLVLTAESISADTVSYRKSNYLLKDRKIDKLLTSKCSGYPLMLLLLILVFWLTITGANYPSALLSKGLFFVQDKLSELFYLMNAPDWLHGILILGVYRVVAWVVSVMLPPMAIFFPLFTLLEDVGYLPRVAYNLDKPFKCCHACGKQALTMCMGFGCNAAGIIGCRIIDSPRERLIAMLTNSFVPCNGRFPTLIAIITMFFIKTSGGVFPSLLSAALLTGIIVFGILMTFLVSKLLSVSILKGVPSSFTLELPPYRKPQVAKVIIRSLFDRTLFVLGRAVVVAAPAGLLIWLMANSYIEGVSVLHHCAGFLDPFAKLLGLDGIILMAFFLGLPANEIVMPIIIMAYLSQGSILEFESPAALKQLLVANGWTWITAISTMLFSLMHWPCSTTLITIKKETGSLKWMVLSFLIPTAIGIIVCFLFATFANLFF